IGGRGRGCSQCAPRPTEQRGGGPNSPSPFGPKSFCLGTSSLTRHVARWLCSSLDSSSQGKNPFGVTPAHFSDSLQRSPLPWRQSPCSFHFSRIAATRHSCPRQRNHCGRPGSPCAISAVSKLPPSGRRGSLTKLAGMDGRLGRVLRRLGRSLGHRGR